MNVDLQLKTGLSMEFDEAVIAIGGALSDPGNVRQIATGLHNQEPLSGFSTWQPSSYTIGHPGIAAFLFRLSWSDDHWLTSAHAHVEAAVAVLPKESQIGISSGPGAVLAALTVAASHPRRDLYPLLRNRLADWTSEHLLSSISVLSGKPVSWSHYDVFSGPTALTRVLISILHALKPDSRARAENAIRACLDYLVQLTQLVDAHGSLVPGWWVDYEQQQTDDDRNSYPHGDLNAGLAHGIAGPLALLCLSKEAGFEVAGQIEAIRSVSDWLHNQRRINVDGAYWPCRVSWEEQLGRVVVEHPLTRDAWCYGTPGVAWSLALAGRALGTPSLTDIALNALREVLLRDPSTWRTDGPSFCHGASGILQICRRAATMFSDQGLESLTFKSAKALLAQQDDDAPFRFRHVTPATHGGWSKANRFDYLDSPGILIGGAGVGAMLHTLTHQTKEGTGDWDSAFLLS